MRLCVQYLRAVRVYSSGSVLPLESGEDADSGFL